MYIFLLSYATNILLIIRGIYNSIVEHAKWIKKYLKKKLKYHTKELFN